MATRAQGILVLGYGNPARGDDGLGPALIEQLAALALAGVETRVDYQLCVEYALELGDFKRVIFVDAALDVAPPYRHYTLPESVMPATLDTHNIAPEALVYLARTLFGASSEVSMLAIRGYQFEPFSESISAAAKQNLIAALRYLTQTIKAYLKVESAPEGRSHLP